MFDVAPLRNIGVHHVDLAKAGVDEAGGVGGFAIEAEENLVSGLLGDDGHAVVGFFALEGHVPAGGGEGLGGKQVVGHLGLLEAKDIGGVVAQPAQDGIETGADGITVECGNAHDAGHSTTRAAASPLFFWAGIRRGRRAGDT